MPYFFAEEELLDRDGIVAVQRRKFAAMVRAVLAGNAFYRGKLADVQSSQTDVAVESFPFTTRAELQQDQISHSPFGTNLTFSLDQYTRLHQTSASFGEPLRVLDRNADWEWWRRCWGIIYRGAGIEPGDRFFFPFSFGPFIGFWAAFESAVAMGNMCLPAGGMTTSARLRSIVDHKVTVICCTPTYALRMAEAAREEGVNLASSAVRLLIVAGEPGGSIPSTRTAIEAAFTARVVDHAGATEVGPHSFECVESPGGVHFIESEFIVEAIDPRSGNTVGEGEEGELVVTNLGRWGMPVIRYRTGDLVRLRRGQCRCGRHFARAEGGILGRIDDMIFIRGNNVYPAQIEDIIRGIDGLAEYRIHVCRRGALNDLALELEPLPGVDAGAVQRRAEKAIQDRFHFRPSVRLAPPGALPRFEMKARRVVREA